MRLPERIQVGPFGFQVTVRAEDMARIRHDRADGRLAETDTSLLVITIDASLPPDQVRDCLLHEVLHATVYAAGGWSKGLTEEDAIRRFSPHLLDTLRRNPQLVAFLTARTEDDHAARQGLLAEIGGPEHQERAPRGQVEAPGGGDRAERGEGGPPQGRQAQEGLTVA